MSSYIYINCGSQFAQEIYKVKCGCQLLNVGIRMATKAAAVAVNKLALVSTCTTQTQIYARTHTHTL